MEEKLQIPREVKIGEHLYNVRKVRVVNWMNKDVAGNINYGLKILKVQKTQDHRMTEGIFFHEVAHGLLKELEFNYPKVTAFTRNESLVNELGLLLRITLKDLLKAQIK